MQVDGSIEKSCRSDLPGEVAVAGDFAAAEATLGAASKCKYTSESGDWLQNSAC